METCIWHSAEISAVLLELSKSCAFSQEFSNSDQNDASRLVQESGASGCIEMAQMGRSEILEMRTHNCDMN